MTDESLSVQLLGGFRVLLDGHEVPVAAWRGTRPAAVVKLLALAPGFRLHREQVIEALWPDLAPAAQTNNLNLAMHRARRAIESVAGRPAGFLIRHGDIVSLVPEDAPVWVDVVAFEQAAEEATRAGSPEVYERAIKLYVGALLPDDLYEPWLERRRDALHSIFLTLLVRLAQLYEQRGDAGRAIATLEKLVAHEPAHEEARVALMRLLATAGQPRLALAQYDELVVALEREVDSQPDAAARELADRIRAGRFPEAPPATPAGAHGAARLRPEARLPNPLTELLGREREIADVRQILEAARLVTLTGAGGIGKTRLAIAVARDRQDAFAEVCFVDLAPIRDPDLVVPTIARALDIHGAGEAALFETLAAYLSRRDVLLVLDNFEHVVDAAPLVSRLLEQCPATRALVTSRVRLGLRGETTYSVPPLVVPNPSDWLRAQLIAASPAITLFARRAAEVKPGFQVTPINAPAIAEICHRLGGVPLAIELAAARSRMLTPQAMLLRLDPSTGPGSLSLLTGGGRDLPDRQQTIRNAITWSYDLLGPQEQARFRQLSVFVGGWTLEAAEAVAAGDDGLAPLDALASLLDNSLIVEYPVADGESRFGTLEPIREFGLERLALAGDEGVVRDRHAAFFVSLAEEIEPRLEEAEQATLLDRLEREEGNLRAALAWLRERQVAELGLRLARALKLYWFVRGRIVEGVEQTVAMLDLADSEAFPELRADCLNTAAFLAREYDYERCAELGAAGLELSRRIGDQKREADALANLAYLALQQRSFEESDGLFREVLRISGALGNQQSFADALSALGLTLLYRDELDEARAMNEEALAIWTALDDRGAMAWAHAQLGKITLQQRDYSTAYRHFTACLMIAGELDFRPGISWALDGLAQLAMIEQVRLPHLAVRLAAAAAAVRERAGSRLHEMEQVEFDYVIGRIRAAIGDNAVETAWARRNDWTLEELTRESREALRPLAAADPSLGRAG